MPLTRLTTDDIPEIMRLERLPGYEALVGRFEAHEHANALAAPDAAYFGIRDGRQLAGFVILQELDLPTVLLRRIAVDHVERGVGTAMLRAAMDWVFVQTPAQVLKLDVHLENHRARHVYEREGFQHYDTDAVHHFLSISRTRWAEARTP